MFFYYISIVFGSVISGDMLLNNELNYTYVPIRESKFLTRNRNWPNFNGFGCSTSLDNISYLFTTNEANGWSNGCSSPKRIVEVFKIDITKKPLYSLLELHHYTDDCSDNINSTYKINEQSELVFQNVYKRANDLFIFNPDFPPFNENKTDLINNKLYYFKKSDRYNLVYGLDYQSRKINSIDRGNHDDIYFGSFINFVLKPKEGNYGFFLNPSLRLDYNESYSLQYCPQIDLNYNQKNYNFVFL